MNFYFQQVLEKKWEAAVFLCCLPLQLHTWCSLPSRIFFSFHRGRSHVLFWTPAANSWCLNWSLKCFSAFFLFTSLVHQPLLVGIEVKKSSFNVKTRREKENSLPCRRCLKHLPRQMPWRHPHSTSEPPQLAPLDTEEQRLDPQLDPPPSCLSSTPYL